MTPQLIVLGGGGHAKVLIEALRARGAAVLGITDPDPAKRGASVLGVPVLGDDDVLARYRREEIRLVNGVGSVALPQARAALFERFRGLGYAFAAVVHPAAVVAADVELGEGAQVMAGAVIQPGCSIGCDVLVNTRAAVDHDCVLGDHAHVAPGATLSGSVHVGERAHVGTGAIVVQGVRIGARSLVGAGALVLRDVAPGVRVVGSPARETGAAQVG